MQVEGCTVEQNLFLTILAWVSQAQSTAQEMYRRMFAMKFLPPGRGLWAMGSKLTTERRLYAALNNCAFVSTQGGGRFPPLRVLSRIEAIVIWESGEMLKGSFA